METVKQFIEKISQIDGIKVLAGNSRDNFINEYLEKVQALAIRKNKKIDIDFLKENLNNNVKYIVNVNYTDEELKAENQSEKFNEKAKTGARPGHFCQGRIVYSNRANDLSKKNILKDHETTHAARFEIFDKDSKKFAIAYNIDNYEIVTNTIDFLKNFPLTTSTDGYDKSSVDENGNVFLYDSETSDLMEICTESFAGMMNEPDEKSFENYSIPTSKMSAISFFRETRDLLIMAIGSDDFIFDMFSRNTSKGFNKLNEKMQLYKDNASIIDYLRISGEYALYDGKIERGSKDISHYEKRNLYLKQMEEYVTDMFLNRIENCTDKDKNEQLTYFCSRLQTKDAKDRVQQLLKGKNGYEDCMNCKLRTSLIKNATMEVKKDVQQVKSNEKDINEK